MAACHSSWPHPLEPPPSHWEALAGARGARPAPSPWREPMGRARGGRVRASPPFCESITRSRWVGSCYSGASTPSPAGLLCVQWTGEYCLSVLPYDLLALHLSPRRRPGLLGAAARASLRLRPGSRAPPGSLPSLGLGRGRGGGCRGAPGGQRLPGLGRGWAGPESCSFPASASLVPNARGGRAALPASRPCPARTRQPSRAPCEPFSSPYPLRAPGVALPAPRRAPALACAALRAPVGLCACAVFPAARTLLSASPARRGPGRGPETPPSCPEGRGPFSAPAGSPAPPRLPTKDGRAPGPGTGEGPAPPLFPPAGGGPGGLFPEREPARRACGDPGATPASGRPLGPCLPCSQRGRRGAGLSQVLRVRADVPVSVDTFVFGR